MIELHSRVFSLRSDRGLISPLSLSPGLGLGNYFGNHGSCLPRPPQRVETRSVANCNRQIREERTTSLVSLHSGRFFRRTLRSSPASSHGEWPQTIGYGNTGMGSKSTWMPHSDWSLNAGREIPLDHAASLIRMRWLQALPRSPSGALESDSTRRAERSTEPVRSRFDESHLY